MWFIWLIIALVIVALILLFIGFIVYHHHYWKFRDIPHESPKEIVDLFKSIQRHVGYTEEEIEQEIYQHIYTRFKGSGAPFCGFYHLIQPRALVLDRELAQRILIKDFSNFNSRGVYYNCRNDPLSADLWSRSGSTWKDMRLKIEPTFRKEQIRHLYACISDESEKLLQTIAAILGDEPQGGLIDINRLARRYVLSTIASCVFGLSTPALQQKYPIEEFEAATELAIHTRRHDVVFNVLLTHYQKLARKLGFSITNRKVAVYFTELIEDVVTQREKLYSLSQEPQFDYLQLLIDIKTQEFATHETDEDFDAKQLKVHLSNELAAHAIGFLKVGFQPTAKTLSYVLYELALNEWAQEEARKEVVEAVARHNNEFNFDCIRELEFMGQVISETVRIHPIVPFIIRRTLNDYHVPNQPKYFISKDLYIIIPTHAMHNDPDNWPEPHLFKPERFAKAENKSREQCLWFGFGEGPRSCIGIQFAQLQIRLAIARLLQEYKFSLNTRRIVDNSQPGVYLQVEPLNSMPTEGTEGKVLI